MFYITVSNGLLTPEHRKKMGSAVWEFMWCIDKVTKIEDGVGYVLGGKPIRLREIDVGEKNTVQQNLKKLSDEGYISTLRTPYGQVIKVLKAKKSFRKPQNSESHETVILDRKTVILDRKTVSAKKTVSDDSTVDITSVTATPSVFNLKEEVNKLENDKRRHIQIIGFYFLKKKPDLRSKEQFNQAIGRHCKSAVKLIPFEDDQIARAFRKASDMIEGWTLETVVKILTK